MRRTTPDQWVRAWGAGRCAMTRARRADPMGAALGGTRRAAGADRLADQW